MSAYHAVFGGMPTFVLTSNCPPLFPIRIFPRRAGAYRGHYSTATSTAAERSRPRGANKGAERKQGGYFAGGGPGGLNKGARRAKQGGKKTDDADQYEQGGPTWVNKGVVGAGLVGVGRTGVKDRSFDVVFRSLPENYLGVVVF